MKVETFLDKLSYAQALALSLSELHQMLGEAESSMQRYPSPEAVFHFEEIQRCEMYARGAFAELTPTAQMLALTWVRGKLGPGAELDRRS